MQCAFPAADGAYFQRHVNGTNSSSSGKISRRPSSMQIMSTILLSGEKMAKLPVGPTRESPRPDVGQARECGGEIRREVQPVERHDQPGDEQDDDVEREKRQGVVDRLPVDRLAVEADVFHAARAQHLLDLDRAGFEQQHHARDFQTAGVLPAQPPTNISSTSRNLEYSGQRLKSAVAKPVVEMIDVTWKNE